MSENTMTLGDFQKQFGNLDQATQRSLAKTLKVELPIATLAEQLSEVAVKAHTGKVTKKNPEPQETNYVAVPSLTVTPTSGTKGFWVKSEVAREVAERILVVCDENGSVIDFRDLGKSL